ncbi:Cancer susceptibility candidate protein [Fasciola hepatica]|uniref:Cancer susceptibility candidate protein n=1 Tax=Fasciola hepatica TaxID=6192 RepID=A0A4E0RFB5_FASHE|nr:Cancer susceptibility candidate protein [Fasciola hepatica]
MPKKSAKSDRKKKEEEEKKRQEEGISINKVFFTGKEAARILAEQEEKERQIKEREERHKRRITEKEELKKRKIELDETREILQEQRVRLEQLEAERRNEYSWKRYFRCDGSPNPSIEKEVNTFMSLWRMDETRLTMEEVMDESVHSLRLIDELRTLVADVGDNEEDNQTLITYRRVGLLEIDKEQSDNA